MRKIPQPPKPFPGDVAAEAAPDKLYRSHQVAEGEVLGEIVAGNYSQEERDAALAAAIIDNDVRLNRHGSPIIRPGDKLVLPNLDGLSAEEFAALTQQGRAILTNNSRGLAALRAERAAAAATTPPDGLASAWGPVPWGVNPFPHGSPRSIDWADVGGKIWNSPNTAVGVAWGLVGIGVDGVGYVFGARENMASIDFGNNAIQFVNNPLMDGRSAITLGNVQIYGDHPTPNTDLRNELTRQGVPLRLHEQPHTYQGQLLGLLYLPSNVLGGVTALALDGDWHGPHNWNEVGPQQNPPRPWP